MNVHSAFVVRVSKASANGDAFHGRVEHALSGKAAEFHSLSEFCEFVHHVLFSEQSDDDETGAAAYRAGK